MQSITNVKCKIEAPTCAILDLIHKMRMFNKFPCWTLNNGKNGCFFFLLSVWRKGRDARVHLNRMTPFCRFFLFLFFFLSHSASFSVYQAIIKMYSQNLANLITMSDRKYFVINNSHSERLKKLFFFFTD